MKAYICTFVPNRNFGAYAQAFALNKALSDFGFEVKILYNNHSGYAYCMSEQQIANPHYLKRALGYLAFEREYLNLTTPMSRDRKLLRKTVADADLVVTGSDQVWITRNMALDALSKYCLDFAKSSGAVLASYAASMGKSDLAGTDKDFQDFFARNLSYFDYVSLRESRNAEVISSITGLQCEVVLDPTLLFTKEAYNDFISNSPVNEKYVYLHAEYARDEAVRSLTQKVSNLSGAKILNNNSNFGRHNLDTFDIDCQVATGYHFSPSEVINAICHASYVVTSSFHCTCFCLIFKKDFYVVGNRDGEDNRIASLLRELDLVDRIVEKHEEINQITSISAEMWNTAHRRLIELRQKSFLFLSKITSLTKKRKKSFLEDRIRFHCFSCSACADICPQKSLKMVEDEEGFSYPVRSGDCTNCKLCERICPQIMDQKTHDFERIGYLSYNLNDEDLRNSSSGGIYPALSTYILSKGGVIAGVKWKDSVTAEYEIADNYDAAYAFRYSKYVEPQHNNIYKRVKDVLESGKLMLFTGAPCKVAGLKTYLGHNYANLITCDILCHGGASPNVFKAWVKAKSEAKDGVAVKSVHFRHPKGTQNNFSMGYVYENDDEELVNLNEDLYMKMFLKNLFFKPSCYLCPYCIEHPSDLTIGDFWGWKSYFENPDNKPISAIVVNTKPGQNLIDNINDKLYLQVVKPWDIYGHNHSSPCNIKPERSSLMSRILKGENAMNVFKEIVGKK